ncbi:unnamed protein product [Candida verbasci]|uniref:Sugar phosphate transporter domain-containing protein n=1 Tax=Candida verbasci TaxID=1227364 RepID=A0A9W4U1J1_9ASCO|nr:unnamed protein product [Candida verbasci]
MAAHNRDNVTPSSVVDDSEQSTIDTDFNIDESSVIQSSPSHFQNQTIQAIIYISGWYFFSLSISIYNKWMFGKGLDFKFPILITSFHQFCLSLLSLLLLYKNHQLRPSHLYQGKNISKFFSSFYLIDYKVYISQILPCSVTSAGDISLSNISISMISLSLYTMLKTSSLIFVLIFGLFFKLEKFNWRLIIIVLIMTVSVVMMTDKPNNSSNSDDYSITGITLVFLASMLSGLRWSFTQILLKSNQYTSNSISTIFYISPFMCVFLFTLGLIFEGWNNFISHSIWEEKGIFNTVVLLIIPGILAFMMTLCEFKLLTVSKVITLSIAGIFKELLTIILSSFIFGDHLSFINIIGLTITFVDILWYNYYRFQQSSDYIKLKNIRDNV